MSVADGRCGRRAPRRRRAPPPGRRARRRRRDPARRAGAHLPRARRALQPARAGAARRRRRARARASRTSTGRRPRSSSCSSRRARSAPSLVPLELAAGGRPSSPRILADAGAPLLIAGRAYADAASASSRTRCRAAAHRRGRRPDYERVARRPRPGRPGRPRRVGRHRRPDVHVGHDRRAEGRPDHAPQPRGGRRDLAALGLRRATRSASRRCRCSTSAASAGRSSGSGTARRTILVSEFDAEAVLDLLERERVTNAVFVPTMLQMLARRAGRRGARLLRAALDRLRRVADHDAGAQGGAAHVPLPAVRRLRPDRDDRRRRAARPGRPRPRRAARAPAALGRPPAIRGSSCGSSIRRRGASVRAARGRRGLAARAERDGRLLQPARGDGGGADAGRLAAHRRRRLPRRRRATSSSPTGSRT